MGSDRPRHHLAGLLGAPGPDVYRDIHLEFEGECRRIIDFAAESREEAHRRTLEALERAIGFLRSEAVGVPHFTFLAYRYLLVVLARFFAHFPEPKPRNRELLRRWYWRAVLAGPGMMPGGTTGAVRALASSVRPGEENESVQRLLNLVPRPAEDRLRVSDFKANRASGHIMLCALWSRGPLSPDSSEPFDPEALALEIGQGQAQVRCALRYSPERSYRGTCVTRWAIA